MIMENTKIQTIIDRLRKVSELEKHGAPGEKEAAKTLLKSILKKYNLTLDDITKCEKNACYFKYKNNTERDLIYLLCRAIYGTKSDEYDSATEIPYKKVVSIVLDKIQEVRFAELWKYYAQQYRRVVKEFTTDYKKRKKMLPVVFVNKVDMFPADYDKENNRVTLSKEDVQICLSLAAKMQVSKYSLKLNK